MAIQHVSDLFIYRWRYTLGYITVGIACIALLFVASLYIPGGLSEREATAVATTNALSLKDFSPEMVVNMPYYLIQKASFFFLGLSELSIKLPTVIFGFLSVVGLVLLLRLWFKSNVAILTAFIGLTTGPFLLAAQSGSPGILFIFWPIWILYFAAMISRRASMPFLWKMLFFIVVVLSLYTPLSAYVLVALLSAVVLHPHLRHLVKNLSMLRITVTVLIASIFILPLVYSVVIQPSLVLTLMGIPSSLDIVANLSQLITQYFDVFHPTNGIIMTPVYEVASLLLVGLGIYRIITAKYTARSYVLSAWLLLLLPILILNPQMINVTFVPFLLLTGYGIDFLIGYWYRLFPRNPYARVVGLIPIMIFITTLILSGIDRFVYGYLYNPSSSRLASNDLTLLKSELPHHKNTVITLIVSANEKAFYEAAKRYNPNWKIQYVVTDTTFLQLGTVIASHDATSRPVVPPTKIVTSAMQTDADRFYVYKNTIE
ncbi:MAG: conserved rane protein of unknown function [Candidatus Saccharibacteria bacterium]|nr:conserved rane protein of unknown function [Candidatus Saccharibacteria bacterium]